MNQSEGFDLKIRAGESLLDGQLQVLPYIVYVFDLVELHSVYQNRDPGADLGYSQSDIEAMGDHWLGVLIHPEDVERLPDLFSRWSTARDDEVFETEYRLRDSQGEYHHFLSRERVFERDTAGAVVRLVGATLDVTERKRLQARLRHSQKLEAIGRLAGGIAHDFNNILTAIIGHVEVAGLDLTDAETVQDCLEQAHVAAMQGAALTRQLLAFASEQVLKPEVIDLSQQVLECMKFLKRVIGEEIQVTLELALDVHPVLVDRAQFVQIVMNLVVNAKDALPAGGLVTVRTRSTRVERGAIPKRPPGSYAVLEVEDNGHGMSAEVQARIFEPFFTTKPPGRGTGLGLATVHGIVRQAGGFLELATEERRGTTVTIYLPRAPETSTTGPSRLHSAPNARGSTVLLVEDDVLVAAMERALLERLGHRAVCVQSAHQAALALDQDDSLTVSLLITDFALVDASGSDLAERVRKRNPELKVLYTSGCGEPPDGYARLREDGVQFLPKPFSAAEFLSCVSTLLPQPKA